jgi:hypothetical protein
MSINLPQFYVVQFATNVGLLLQQKGSMLRKGMTEGHYVGKQASPIDQVAQVNANRVTSRFAPMSRVDAVETSRWVYPVDYDLPQLIDTFDKLRLIVDPESAYVTNAVYAMGRAMDSEIINGFFTTALTGLQGATAVTFPTANVVGVSTGGTTSNINVPKLRAAKKLLMSYFVDFDNDEVFCAITSNEHDALLNEIQVISSDFNEPDRPVMHEGRVHSFLGIKFIHCELLFTLSRPAAGDDLGGTSTAIPVWAKSGMHLGLWQDPISTVSRRNDLQAEPWQVYTIGTFGATRVEENKVIKIWCR